MELDENNINRIALRIVRELVTIRYDLTVDNKEEEREYMLMTLGEIGGVVDLAEELVKEVKTCATDARPASTTQPM